MASKTRVGGTNYEVKGGKCRVSGTNYSIKKGRTLVGGTGYDISFAPSVVLVSIGAPDGNQASRSVKINGATYTESASGIEVMSGDAITFMVRGYNSSNYGEVVINGTQVLKVTNPNPQNYEWTVPKGIAAISIVLSGASLYGVVDVATYEKIGAVQFTINGALCYADANMTWKSWVNSGYNKMGFYVDGSYIRDRQGFAVHDPVADSVYLATQTIVSGREYNLISY
jgi:hypothetical protein